MKKLTSILLALLMALTLLPTAVFATETGSATKTDDSVAYVVGGLYYNALDAAVASVTGSEQTTIELLKNCEGNGVVVTGTQNIVFDFGGYAYTLKLGVGSTNSRTNGFQLLQGSSVVMKNGTIKISASNVPTLIQDEASTRDPKTGRNIMRLVQSYANTTLTDMTFDATNLYGDSFDYVLSFNKGNVLINGATTIVGCTGTPLIFDSCDGSWAGHGVYDNDPVVSVTIDTTGTIPGKVELWGGHMTVNQGDVDLIVGATSPDLVVGENANVTLDLNGKKMAGSADKDTITNNGNLTITDTSTGKTGTIESAPGKSSLNNGNNATTVLSGTSALTTANTTGDNASAKLSNGNTIIGKTGIIDAAKAGNSMEVLNGTDIALTEVPAGTTIKFNNGASGSINGAAAGEGSYTLAGANYTELDKAIAAAERLNASSYKDFSGVTAALTAAKAVDRNLATAYQSTVDDATNDLNDAMNALVRKSYRTHLNTTPTVEKAESPKTFDAGIAIYGVMAVSSVLGMGYMGKKKFF